MAKIHKSTNISIDKSSPVILDIPVISKGLRDLVLGGEKAAGNTAKKPQSHSVESYYVESVMKEANEKSQKILEDAKKIASQIESEAKENSTLAYEFAKCQGYKDGMEQSFFEIEKLQHLAKKEVKQEVENLKKQVNKELLEIEKEIIEISLLISERITCSQIENDDKAIANMLAQALENIKDKKNLKVFVDRRDIDKITGLSQIKENDINVLLCDSFNNHQCVIESLEGKIDLSWKKKLEIIANEIAGVF